MVVFVCIFLLLKRSSILVNCDGISSGMKNPAIFHF